MAKIYWLIEHSCLSLLVSKRVVVTTVFGYSKTNDRLKISTLMALRTESISCWFLASSNYLNKSLYKIFLDLEELKAL